MSGSPGDDPMEGLAALSDERGRHDMATKALKTAIVGGAAVALCLAAQAPATEICGSEAMLCSA